MSRHKARRKIRPHALLAIVAASFIALATLNTATTGAVFTSSAPVGSNTFATHTMSAVAGLTVTNPVPGLANLSWTASSKADGYLVSRATVSGGPYTQIATVTGRTNTSYSDTNAPAGTSYYQVRAYIAVNWVSPTTGGSGTSPTLGGVTNLTATGSNTQITVSWTGVANATKYNIYQARCQPDVSTCGQAVTLKTSTTGTTYVFDDGLAGQVYDFTVAPVDVTNTEGTMSNKVSAKTTAAFAPITTFTAEYGNFFGLYENAKVSYGSNSEQIFVERSIDGGAFQTWRTASLQNYGGADWTGGSDLAGWTPPKGGHNYVYRYRGCNTAGCTAWVSSSTYRVPYWYAAQAVQYGNSGQVALHRLSTSDGNAGGELINYGQAANTTTYWAYNQCPAFRSCTGTDKATLMKAPAYFGGFDYRGYIWRSSTAGGNDGPSGTAARTWVWSYKGTGTYLTSRGILGQDGASGSSSWGLRTGAVVLAGSTARIQWVNGTNFPTASKINDGQWHQYALVYSGGTVTLYEDGASLGSLAVTVNTSSSGDLTLGGPNPQMSSTYGISNGLAGTYDEWSVMRKALTATEVGELWAARADGD